jgi:hypothetical protein
MTGFRAAGWTCFAAAVVSFLIGLVGLRGIGIVGTKRTDDDGSVDGVEKEEAVPETSRKTDNVEMTVIGRDGENVQDVLEDATPSAVPIDMSA